MIIIPRHEGNTPRRNRKKHRAHRMRKRTAWERRSGRTGNGRSRPAWGRELVV